jgi:hypothetical protein
VLEGQEATVLQLPAHPVPAANTKAQERVFAPQLFSSFS